MYVLPLGIIINEAKNDTLQSISLVALVGQKVKEFVIEKTEIFESGPNSISNIYNMPPSRISYKFELKYSQSYYAFNVDNGEVQKYHYAFKKVEVVELDKLIKDIKESMEEPLENIERGVYYNEKTHIIVVEDNESIAQEITGSMIIRTTSKELEETIKKLKSELMKYKIYYPEH